MGQGPTRREALRKKRSGGALGVCFLGESSSEGYHAHPDVQEVAAKEST